MNLLYFTSEPLIEIALALPAPAALRRLVRLRIVKQVGAARRDRVFCAQALLDILEEPARLRPD
jgi:hypothetical protein